MLEETNPIRAILYGYIQKLTERKIQILVSHGKSSEIISDIISNCYDKVIKLEGSNNENIGKLAESLMHFLLTASLTNSQRKISRENIEIDIIIPDFKTLSSEPNDVLVICFPKTLDIEIINLRIKELEKIQPIKENIWLVLNDKLELNYKTYIIKNSFSNILNDIEKFMTTKKQTPFKIFRT